MKKIGDYAFSGNPTLENVVMEEGVETIGAFAFHDCTSKKEIPYRMLSDCDSLTEIIVPEGIESIRNMAFEKCDKLKK